MKILPTFSFICLLTISPCFPAHAQEETKQKEKAPLLSGVAVSADLVGFAMKACNAKYANMEVGARINILDKYFPAAELGIGDCKREGAETGNIFSTTSPYMRFGLDYNDDPTYHQTISLDLSGQKATAHWLEFGIGVETKLWSFIRLGWSIRYKFRAALSHPEEGKPYYIPGFGKNDSNGWGGTVNLVFDVGKTKRKQKTEKQDQ